MGNVGFTSEQYLPTKNSSRGLILGFQNQNNNGKKKWEGGRRESNRERYKTQQLNSGSVRRKSICVAKAKHGKSAKLLENVVINFSLSDLHDLKYL